MNHLDQERHLQSLDNTRDWGAESTQPNNPMPLPTRLKQLLLSLPSLYRHCLGCSVNTLTPENSSEGTEFDDQDDLDGKGSLLSEVDSACGCCHCYTHQLTQQLEEMDLQLPIERAQALQQLRDMLADPYAEVLERFEDPQFKIQLKLSAYNSVQPASKSPTSCRKRNVQIRRTPAGALEVFESPRTALQLRRRPRGTEAGTWSPRLFSSSSDDSATLSTDESTVQLPHDMPSLFSRRMANPDKLRLLPPLNVADTFRDTIHPQSGLMQRPYAELQPVQLSSLRCTSTHCVPPASCGYTISPGSRVSTLYDSTSISPAATSANQQTPRSASTDEAWQDTPAASDSAAHAADHATELLADWEQQDSEESDLGSPTGRRLVELAPDDDGHHSTDSPHATRLQYSSWDPQHELELPQLRRSVSPYMEAPGQHAYGLNAAPLEPRIELLEVLKLSVLGPVMETVLVHRQPDCADVEPSDYPTPRVLHRQYTDEWEQPPDDYVAAATSSWLYSDDEYAGAVVYVRPIGSRAGVLTAMNSLLEDPMNRQFSTASALDKQLSQCASAASSVLSHLKVPESSPSKSDVALLNYRPATA